jgi:TRAP-type C4-dicarboxylate transport system permease small subunit
VKLHTERFLKSMLNGYALFKRMYGKVNFVCGFLSTTAVLMIMAGTMISAFSRWIRIPINGIDELNGLLTGMAIYLGLAAAQAAKTNITVKLFVQKLSVRFASLLNMFMLAIAAVFFTHLAYIDGIEAYRAFVGGDVVVSVVEWPLWPLALTVFVGVSMLSIQLFIDVIERAREFTANRSKQPASN